MDTFFGPWEMIGYAPLLALRQLGAKRFIPATAKLASLEIIYGQSRDAQLLSQIMQAWKDPHRTRLGQLIEGALQNKLSGEGKILKTQFCL